MNPSFPFAELLTRIGREGQAVRLAYGQGRGGFSTALVPHDHLEQAIDTATEAGYNVWFEINPSNFDSDKGRSSAGHITRLAALYVDIDFKRDGMGSEHAARELIDELAAALGLPPAAVVSTGNGLQPYWAIDDADIDDDSRERVSMLIARWKVFVDTFAYAAGGTVDSLFDLPRIFRVPGSMNWKDPENPKPVTLDLPGGYDTFTVAELEEIFDAYGVTAHAREIATEVVSTPDEWDYAEHDCHFVERFRSEVVRGEVHARHPWLLSRVATVHAMLRYGCLTEDAFIELRRLIDKRFTDLCRSQEPVREPAHGEINAALTWGLTQVTMWPVDKLVDEMRSHAHDDFIEQYTSGQLTAPVTAPAPALEAPARPAIGIFSKQPVAAPRVHEQPATAGALALTPQAHARLTVSAHTDSGNAELFAQHVAGRFIHVSGMGWHHWDGARFARDEAGLVNEALKDLFTHRLATSVDLDEQKWLQQSLNNARLSATLKWAESVPAVQVSPADLDANLLEISTPAGIVDLAAGTIRPADPLVDRHTKITRVAPDFTASPTRFLGVLHWAFEHDPSVVDYLQRLFGLALIGEQRAQIFPIFLGRGANGKSLLFHILLAVIGGYGAKLAQDFLVLQRNESHPEAIASLRGVRLALASEVPATSKFNEERVKALTGDTTIRARLMRENSYEFRNTVSIMLAANHLPSVPVGGPGWWRRVRVIDMPKTMPPEQQIPTLGDDIVREEGPAVLAWMIQGAMRFLAEGEKTPLSITEATRRYQVGEDTMARFLEEQLVLDPAMVTTRAGVYQNYQMWANTNRIFPLLSAPKFIREMLMYLPQQPIDDTVNLYGIRLRQAPPVNRDPYDIALGL